MKLLVLDGNSILNRAFYGIKLLSTKDGLFTNGIYGFYNILNKLMNDVKPDAAAVAFDLPAPTFRHKAFDGYKAKRKGMPEELHVQVPLLKELLDRMGIVRLEAEGFEADDILGTQAAACTKRGDECVIATGDRDSLQLVGEHVTVLLAGTKGGRPETTTYGVDEIREKYGVTPRQLIEVKALMGDASDNIPGVAGVGEKTALSLISQYGSVREIYDRLDTLKLRDSLRSKLTVGRESAFMSHGLAEIHTDAPVETDIEKLKIRPADAEGLYHLLRRLEFYKIIEKLGLTPTQGMISENKKDGVPAGKVTAHVETSAENLLCRIRESKAADFCAVLNGGRFEAACFALSDKTAIVLRDKTEGFDGLLKAVFTDAGIKKRTHDLKLISAACERLGYDLAGECFDTMLAGYILNPLASSYEPARLCDALGEPLPTMDIPFGVLEDVAECAQKAVIVSRVGGKMADKMEKNGQHRLYYDIELPLARVLGNMENVGFRVDAQGIEQFGGRLEKRIEEIQKEIFGMVGYEFNVNSPKQLGEALFVKLGLPPKKKTKTGFSTNAEVLEGLRGYHPVIDSLLEFRQLSKLKSTYTDGLLKVIGPDGRIHSSFNQVETRTGRISSTEPNLQNIPVRSEIGREMRKFFIPKEGSVLIDADYSQIELRILAHIADDQSMTEAFNRHDDIHAITASQVFKIPLDMVTPLMRSRAKAVNFGIVYGIGAFSLSQDIGVSVKEADRYIRSYLETFSGVRDYMERVVAEAKEKGYVETMLGRRRTLPELASSNRNIRNFGERVARNTPIQGTAADIIKIAMVRVFNRLRSEKMQAKLILQVHDELIVEAPLEEAEKAAQIVHEEMENAMPLNVKLEADVHFGDSWFSAKNG